MGKWREKGSPPGIRRRAQLPGGDGLMQRDYEADIRSVYQSILVDGDIAIDVGAHVGEHSIGILEKITPRGHLYAVEPLPAKFREMSERIAHYYPSWRSNLTCYDCALSDRRGRDEFVVAVDAPWFSGLKRRADTAGADRGRGADAGRGIRRSAAAALPESGCRGRGVSHFAGRARAD